jgi:glucans biosynthesis protein
VLEAGNMRTVLITCLVSVGWAAALSNLGAADVQRITIDRAWLETIAADRAANPYAEPKAPLPRAFAQMDYDDYRRIRFLPEKGLWYGAGLPYRAEFFHRGGLFQRPVRITEFTATHAQLVPFLRTNFDYQDLRVPRRTPEDMGYAGFRVLHELHEPGKWDEVVSFLGSNYFRALGRHHHYGLSARAVALNTAGTATEEFPDFVEFWLGKPEEGSDRITIHALLDSPSVAGAYTFTVVPGDATTMQVHGTLFFRTRVDEVGLAPLTSMFWFGEHSRDKQGDFRSEVHDSDGLLVLGADQSRVWRPLRNPTGVTTTETVVGAVAGFGLLQRDRLYSNYGDAEARYDLRPSAWVATAPDWPPGKTVLLELPTDSEYHDNIVAYWRLERSPEAGERIDFRYELHWTSAAAFGPALGYVSSTRRTHPQDPAAEVLWAVDFTALPDTVDERRADVQPVLDLPEGVELVDIRTMHVPADDSWRVSARLKKTDPSASAELALRLRLDEADLTETWKHTW